MRKNENYVLTIGMLCLDMIVRPVSRDFFEKDSMHVDIDSMPGGDACNVALNLAAMEVPVKLLTLTGDDVNGRFLREYLKDHNVDADCSGIGKAGTALSLVMVEPDGERHFLTTTDIFDEISPEIVTDELLSGASFVTFNSFFRMLQMDGEAVAGIFRRARQAGKKTAMDTMPFKKNMPPQTMPGSAPDPYSRILPALKETDYFLPSYDEACQITGETDVLRMRERLSGLGIRAFGVKLGSEGSYITDFEKEYLVPALPDIVPVSTTGAGDSFFAGFVKAVMEGRGIVEAAAFGTCAAALTIQVPGASGGIRSAEAVRKLYDNYPREQVRRIFRLKVNGFETIVKVSEGLVENRLRALVFKWTGMQRSIGRRLVIFLAGAPGAGKSTLAALLEILSQSIEGAETLKAAGLDGFHYTMSYLSCHYIEEEGEQIPLLSRKGSPETFNTDHFEEKLRELTERGSRASHKDGPVTWPVYDRMCHDVMEDAMMIKEKIVLIEGNWLLLDEDPWKDLRKYADLTVFLKAPQKDLRERLITRKVRGGLPLCEAECWYDDTDLPNVKRAAASESIADSILEPLEMEL